MADSPTRGRRASLLCLAGCAVVLAASVSMFPGAQRRPGEKPKRPRLIRREARRQRARITAPTRLARRLRLEAARVGRPSRDVVGSKSRQWTAITTEGFEGSFPPPLWEAEDGDSQPPEAYWGRDDWQEHSGNYSAYCVRSGAQGVDPAVGEYPNNASSWLVYGPFDLSDASQATLDFFAWIDTEADYDFFYWVASADGTNFDGWQISGNSSGWIAQDLDLSDVGDVHANMCGEPEVWIAFVFESDYSVTAKGVFVDDVLLRKSSGLGVPKLVNPINHTTLTTSYPPFEWRNVVAATGYEIIVDDSDAFTAPYVFSDADVTSTSVTPTSPIPDGTYYWKVRAKDGDTVGPWSQAWDFAVRTTDRPEWTFMVYLDADNNLESFGMDDLLEMVAAADNANVNICVLFDRALGYVTTYDNWTTTRRYKVTTATTPYDASPDYTDLGEMNMGDPQTVVDFVTWAQTNYPAEHYALIYWDHGAGWEPRLRGPMPTKIICIDSGSGNDFLELNELYDAMGAFPEKVDLCGMDACLMGQMEVAYHIRDRCDYFVASESSEPGPGWPYDLFLSSSQLPSGTEPAQLAARIVEAYRAAYDVYNLEATQSAWASDGLTTCANKVSALANELLTGLETYGGEIGAAWNAAVRFEAYSGQRAYIDLYGFCHYLRQNISDASGKGPRSRIARGINSAAGDLMDYLVSPTFQIAEWNDREAFGANTPVEGMSIYFPQTSAEYFYGQYNGANLRFVADPAQLWDEFLRAYLTGASPPSPPQALAAVDRPGDDGGAVELTWSRSPDDGVGDDDVTQYRIFRDHALIHTMPADDSPSYGYMDTGLQNGTEYCYMVRAYDGTMESPNSNTDCATPVANGGGPSIAVDLDPDAPGIQTARTVTQGANFDVAIWALNAQDLASYNAVVRWTADQLTANAVAQGPFLRSAGGDTVFPTPDLHAGWLEASEAVLSPTGANSPDGDGLLFTVNFTSGGSGITSVEFSTDLGAGTIFGNPAGEFAQPDMQAGVVTVGVPGDQDDDGDVDVDDLAVFRLHWGGVEGVSAKGRAPCGTYDANCDLNQDGEVNREDFWMMWYDNAPHHSDWPVGDVTGDAASAGCAVGYPDAAPDAFVGFFDLVAFTDKWHTQEGDAEWDETFDFAGPAGSQPTGPEKPCPVDGKVDFYDLVRFAAAWHTGEGPAQPLDGGKRPVAEVRPTLLIEASPQGALLPGDEVELQINAADVRDLRAYDFRLLFDSNALEIVECDSEEGGFLESAGGDALFMQDLRQPGVAWLTGSLIGRHRERAPDGDGTLARLRLRIKADATRTTIRLAHGRTLDWSGTLATAAPGEIALDVGALEEGDWRCEVVARCGGRLDRGNYFGVVADPDVRRAAPKRARDGGGPQVVFLTQDGPSSRQYLPPGAARLVYRFAVQHAPPGEDVAVSFPDVSSVPRQMTVRLIDEASQAVTSVRTQSTYRYHTGNATTRTFRIEVEPTRRGALLLSGLSAVPTRGRAVSIDFWLSADAAADVAIYNVAGRAVRHLARGQLRAAGRQSVLWDARSDVGTQVPAGTYIIRAAARASDGSKSEAVTSVTLVR